MNIKTRIIMASILGVLVGMFFWISDIIQKYSSRRLEEAVIMGGISLIGFFIGNSIDCTNFNKTKKFLLKVIFIWFVLLTSIFIFVVFLNSDKFIWYTLTIMTCFSIPIIFSNVKIIK